MMCVTVCVCQCVWVCGDWEWNTHMAANYRWAASQTWSSWQAHTQTDREREREKKRGSTRSLSYCNHAELWIQERPIRWGTLAPDKTTPVSFWPCHNYKAVQDCDSNMPNVHSTQLPFRLMPRNHLRSLPGQPLPTYIFGGIRPVRDAALWLSPFSHAWPK